MKLKIIFLVSIFSFSGWVLADVQTSYDCQSIDVTHYPYYRMFIEKLAKEGNQYVVLGTKKDTDDFRTYTTKRFWHIVVRKDSQDGSSMFQWNEADSNLGNLVIYKSDSRYVKGELSLDLMNPRSVPVELVCH